MKTLHFEISIKAPRPTVWSMMLEPETYKQWTAAFVPGSYYEGSWEKGAKIRFLSPEGQGMVSEIAENRKHEFISIRHLGIIKDGKEDTESQEARSWAPAYESYTFEQSSADTRVLVDMDIEPQYADMFNEVWPRALARLKEICEK
jgi:hypothetical protein